MRRSLLGTLLLLWGGLVFSNELDGILSPYLSPRDKRDLASLTRTLDSLESRYREARVAAGSSAIPDSGLEPQIRETAARIGTLVRDNLGKLNSRGWQNLRDHLLRRYAGEFLPRTALEEIEKALPPEARRKTLSASYSAISFLKSAQSLLPPSREEGKLLVQYRERTLRLQDFAAETPDFLRLLESLRSKDHGNLGTEERKKLSRLLSAGRVFGTEDWQILSGADPLCFSLINDGFQVFASGAGTQAARTAAALKLPLGDYLRGPELLYLASRSREKERDLSSLPAAEKEEAPADPNFRKNLADGREIADRVLEVFHRGDLDSGTGARLAVLELLNHRTAGRLFLSAEKYLPARGPFYAFLEELYREVDSRAAMLLGYGGAGTSSAVRDVFSDLLRQQGFTTRLICLYREETSTGFPNPFEADPREAREAYARAFWAVSQGDESEVNLETALEWAQAHGQILIPLPLFLSLKSGKEALSLYLASYPDGVVLDYPDFASVFDALAREAAYPWFRWSYRITYPLLKTEYRSRGFEAILAAHRIVTQVFGLPSPGDGREGKILEHLESLKNLRISEEELQNRLNAGEDLPAAVDLLIDTLRDNFLPLQGDFLSLSRGETLSLARTVGELDGRGGDFPGQGAVLLARLNDYLDERSLSGEDYLRARNLVFHRIRELFLERGEEAAYGPWLDRLAAAGLISPRERFERSVP